MATEAQCKEIKEAADVAGVVGKDLTALVLSFQAVKRLSELSDDNVTLILDALKLKLNAADNGETPATKAELINRCMSVAENMYFSGKEVDWKKFTSIFNKLVIIADRAVKGAE